MNKNLLGTDVVTQIGILVNDIEKTAGEYAKLLGVEMPPIGITDTVEISKTNYRGNESLARTKQAFFHVGPNVDIELLEPDHEPSTWRHDLDTKGEGVHHIAFVINGMKKVISDLEGLGYEKIQTGEWIGGRYAYLDANEQLKLTLELLEIDE